MATLVCLDCGTPVPEDALPDDPTVTIRCQQCKGSHFVACVEWKDRLSYEDKRLLRSLRIAQI